MTSQLKKSNDLNTEVEMAVDKFVNEFEKN